MSYAKAAVSLFAVGIEPALRFPVTAENAVKARLVEKRQSSARFCKVVQGTAVGCSIVDIVKYLRIEFLMIRQNIQQLPSASGSLCLPMLGFAWVGFRCISTLQQIRPGGWIRLLY